jgi:hypothetical protein
LLFSFFSNGAVDGGFSIKLDDGECVVLENKFPKSKRSLMLTNKRVVFGEKKHVITEICLDQIVKVSGVVDDVTSFSSLILDLCDGEQIHVTFEVLSGGHVLSEASKKIAANFLEAINKQIKSSKGAEKVQTRIVKNRQK